MDAGKGYNISMNQDKRHKISTREVRFALDEITDIRKKLSEAMEYLLSRKKLDDIPVSEIAKMAVYQEGPFTVIFVINMSWLTGITMNFTKRALAALCWAPVWRKR